MGWDLDVGSGEFCCRENLTRELGVVDLYSRSGIDESVRKDMRVIKDDPFLPKDLEVVGYVYDVFSGKTTEVGQM